MLKVFSDKYFSRQYFSGNPSDSAPEILCVNPIGDEFNE